MDATYINVDLSPGSAPGVLNVSQNDSGRPLGVNLFLNGAAFTLTGYGATVETLKPDGNLVTIAGTVSGNTVTWSTTEQQTAVAGKCMTEVRITDGSADIGSANFILMVESSPEAEGVESESEIASITEQVEALVAASTAQTYDPTSTAPQSGIAVAQGIADSFPTAGASGAVASFADGADNIPIKDMTVNIEPVQAGTGDPSPTNIRAISGWENVNVVRTGKNLFSFGNVTKKTIYRANMKPIGNSLNDVYLSGASGASDDQQLSVYSWAYCGLYLGVRPFDADTSVTLSCNVINYTADCSGYVALGYIGDNGSFVTSIRYTFNEVGTIPVVITGTIPAGYAPMIRATPANKGTTVTLVQYAELHNIQLEVGSTATAYEPYQGTTYPITFPSSAGTVCGGTLDVTNGVLTVDRAMVNISVDWGWKKSGSFPGGFYVAVSSLGYKTSTPFMCSHAKAANSISEYIDGTCYCDGALNFRIMSATSTAQDWKDYIAGQMENGTPIQIAYELATPVTYQLTPVQIRTLLGDNNIWADCGNVSVTYRADPNLYVDGKIEPIKGFIAAEENGDKASQAYTAGRYFIHNGAFCKALTNIASGATFTLGTNYTVTTIGAELYSALNS